MRHVCTLVEMNIRTHGVTVVELVLQKTQGANKRNRSAIGTILVLPGARTRVNR